MAGRVDPGFREVAGMNAQFTDFDSWKKTTVDGGAKVKRLTLTHFNTHYIALKDGRLVGTFNTFKGTKGRSPFKIPSGQYSD